MTIQEMHDWFDFMVDKFDSPFYTDDEKDLVLNRAQLDYVNNLALPREEDQKSEAEVVQDWERKLHPIIDPISLTATAGLVSTASLNGAVSTGKIVKVLQVSNSSSEDIKFVRHNDFMKFNRNFFKKASTTYQQFTVSSLGINIFPAATEEINFKILREPVEVDLSTPTNCELPSFTHNKIVAKAIAMAGIATEEQASAALYSFTQK